MNEDDVPEADGANAAPPRRSGGELGWRATGERLLDALEVAVRHPRRWLAGFAYQFLALGWAFGVAAAVGALGWVLPEHTLASLGFGSLRSSPAFDSLAANRTSLLGLAVLVLALRLAPGLARAELGAAGDGALSRGRGFAVATTALWVQVVLTMLAASLATVLATTAVLGVLGADPGGPLPKVLFGLALGFLTVYGATLGALYHLALASLVRHRRGAGSALLHAWRLVRSQPPAAARAILVEGLLYGAWLALDALLPLGVRLSSATALVGLALSGAARAAFWARTYSALGGVEPVPDSGPASRVVTLAG